jgi:plasmid stabilization system protein ParE
MTRLHLSSPAERDSFELWAYIAKDNIDAADRMVARLQETFDLLLQHPNLGEAHVHRGRDVRRVTVSPYVVI